MEIRKRTYVRFVTMMGILPPREVESRDPDELDIPPSTQGFVFYDEAVIVAEGFEWPSLPANESPPHYVNARVLTLEEFQNEFANQQGVDQFVEQLRDQGEEKVVVTAAGQAAPWTEGAVIVEVDFNDPELEV